jgi:hypothetical protein
LDVDDSEGEEDVCDEVDERIGEVSANDECEGDGDSIDCCNCLCVCVCLCGVVIVVYSFVNCVCDVAEAGEEREGEEERRH